MTDLNAMWTALVAHQPLADKRGYGADWARMCAERTKSAAYAAAWIAAAAEWAAADAAAEWAADAVADTAVYAEYHNE